MPIYSLGERKVEFRGREWFVAPTASVIGSVVLGNEANIWFDVVIRGDNELITIGERVNVQDGSVLHADPGFPLTLARGVSVGHKAMLHGCTVGEGSLIGMNSVVMNGAVIGKGSIVGSNALVAEGKTFPGWRADPRLAGQGRPRAEAGGDRGDPRDRRRLRRARAAVQGRAEASWTAP